MAIWAAILAFDGSCSSDLARDGAREAFVAHLTYLSREDDSLRRKYGTEKTRLFYLSDGLSGRTVGEGRLFN